MIIFKKTVDLQAYLRSSKIKTDRMGFVPTMGALHEGHLSLIRESRQANTLTVSCIFINPTQFNDPKDFEKYPVTLDKDIYELERAGTDILFLPSVAEIYPDGTMLTTHYDLGFLETVLEGQYRPGHFQGVCTVVHRLLEIVHPSDLYLGQKDYQQCMVLQLLIQQLALPVRLHVCPTVREPDGLAMSSRNLRLSQTARPKAVGIYRTLQMIQDHFQQTGPRDLVREASMLLLNEGFQKVDYVEICDAASLEFAQTIDAKKSYIAMVAAFMDEVRLIDNLILH